ncbi:Rhs element Vgr protein [Caballeronia arationis]|nr:Rhs element Vgr protein [Caballeronia arationis]
MAVRGAKGVYISADAQRAANGKQLDMQPAQDLLEQALQQMQSLAEAAKAAQAIAADYGQQKAFLDGTLNELKKAGVLVSAPAGVGLISGAHLQLSANQNLIATAGGNADIGVLKRFTVAAGEAVSLFAQKLGMKLFAAKGKVEIRAQSDEMALAALKDVTITSTEGKLILSAAKEVRIGVAGSYIKINAERIENGTPGDILEKCASWDKPGAGGQSYPLPSLPHGELLGKYSLRFATAHSDDLTQDIGWIGKPYQIIDSAGTVLHTGKIAKDGRLPRTILDKPDTLTLRVGFDDWDSHQISVSDDPEPRDERTQQSPLLSLNEDPFRRAASDQPAQFIEPSAFADILSENTIALASKGEE